MLHAGELATALGELIFMLTRSRGYAGGGRVRRTCACFESSAFAIFQVWRDLLISCPIHMRPAK